MNDTNQQQGDVIPTRLYKYRFWTDEYHKKMLTHNVIYFASAHKFNDPFDCRIPVEIGNFPDSFVRKVKTYLLKEATPQISEEQLQIELDIEMNQRTWEDPTQLQKWLDKEQEKRFEQGIFGLSEPRDKLLMWSHYADSHKGFCVGFDTKALLAFFALEILMDEKHVVLAKKVDYLQSHPQFQFFPKDRDEFYVKPLIVKSSDWKYEQEIRFIRTHKADVEYTLPDGIIVELIFGCEMPEGHRDEIMEMLREKGSQIELFEARKKDKSFGLDFVSVDID